MAIVNDYITGTITLTSGSANFTSTGAALQSAGIRAGDEILLPAKGMVLVIASITGENAGTLVQNCPAGAAGAAQPMRIRFQPDGSRYTAAARALVELLADGKLTSLAGQTGAANKLPYLTGATTFGLADLTAFGRSLLDDANAAAALTTLGIPVSTGSSTNALLSSTGTAPTATYTSSSTAWYKIGRIVVVNVSMRCVVSDVGSGALRVEGLPFAVSSPGPAVVTVPALLNKACAVDLQNGTTYFRVWDIATNNTANVSVLRTAADTFLFLSAVYMAAT